jgi:hypothetical protein
MLYTSNITILDDIAAILWSLKVFQVILLVCSKKRSLMVSVLRSLGSYMWFTSFIMDELGGLWFIYLISGCPVGWGRAGRAGKAEYQGLGAVDSMENTEATT